MRDLNPEVPVEYLQQAREAILQPASQDPLDDNFRIHKIFVEGYRAITYIDSDGIEQTPTIRLISHRPEENELLAVQQVTVRTAEHERRFDIVLFLNGMPVVFFELKQAGSKHADLPAAHAQFQTYLREFPMAFRFAVPQRHQRRHHGALRLTVYTAGALRPVERRRRRQSRGTWPTA